jgi:molybdopterin converting factor small subunit
MKEEIPSVMKNPGRKNDKNSLTVTVKFSSLLGEKTGAREAVLKGFGRNLSLLFEALHRRFPALEGELSRPHILVAVNDQLIILPEGLGTQLQEGDVVHFHHAVAGG